MKRTIATTCVLAMMLGGAVAQVPTPQGAPQKTGTAASAPANSVAPKKAAHKKKAAPKKQSAKVAPAHELPAQTMPPVPATLMNSEPVKPNVTMDGGLLTIDAPNCTLNDVLNGVRKATGASIEGASPTERIAVRLGPGYPEQVIAALLRGTPYDYVILGSLGKNDAITRVLLTPASAATSNQPTQALSSPSPERHGQPPPPPGDETLPERTPPDDMSGAPSPDEAEQPQPDQPPPAQQQPAAQAQQSSPSDQPAASVQSAQQDQSQQQAQPQTQDPNQPKTPEQLFKELQDLEQQKQQQR